MDGQEPQNPINPHQQDEQVLPDAAPESTANYENFQPPKKEKKSRNFKKPLLIFIIIAAVVGLFAGAYLVFFKSKPATPTNPQSSNSSSNSNSNQQNSNSSNNITTATKHYESSNFNLSFDYPEDWKVTDVAGSGRLTVVSPTTQLKDSSGQSVSGQIVMTIRDNSQKLTEFDKGNATAAKDSEKIAYTKPSETQRGSTYISFLSYAGSETSGGLNGIYITGDNGYKKDQAIPKVDITKVDPLISITFTKDKELLSISVSSWSDTAFSQPLKTMLQSLKIQ